MKKSLLQFFIICCAYYIQAQPSPSDCEGAIVLCGDLYSELAAPEDTGNVYEYTGACNANLETMSLWYTFTAQTDGILNFVLTPNVLADDYDWGLFEITDGGCEGIAPGGASPEVSCSSYGTFGENGPTGISSALGGVSNTTGPGDTNGPAFTADLPVTTGQTYALVVMNWSNSVNGFTIDFAGSTAELYDNVSPTVIAFEYSCADTLFHITFSEQIQTATVELEDFTVTDSEGNSYSLSSVAPEIPGNELNNSYSLLLDSLLPSGGEYMVYITDTSTSGNVSDPCGNLALDASFQINVPALIDYEVVTQYACNGSNGMVKVENITGGIAPLQIEINGNEEMDSTLQYCSPGIYSISVSDVTGCPRTRSVEVPNQDLSLDVPIQDSITCTNPVVQFENIVIAPEIAVEYMWYQQNDLGVFELWNANTPNPATDTAGQYRLTILEPISGCSVSREIEIKEGSTAEIDLSYLDFPNVLTPQGDGKNETWRPFLRNIPKFDITSLFELYELFIYNRWGNEIYNTLDSVSRNWLPNDLPAGTYYYVLHFKIVCGAEAEGTKSGWLEILK